MTELEQKIQGIAEKLISENKKLFEKNGIHFEDVVLYFSVETMRGLNVKDGTPNELFPIVGKIVKDLLETKTKTKMTPTHPTDGTPIPNNAPVNNDNDGKTKAPKDMDTYPANIPAPDAKNFTTPAPEVKDTPNTEVEPPVPGQENIEEKLPEAPPAVTHDDDSTIAPPSKKKKK